MLTLEDLTPLTVVDHKKGGRYLVIGVATHSETGEKLVVYESLKDNKIWVRPLDMFLDGRFSKANLYQSRN